MPDSSKIEQYLEAIYRGQNASVSVLLPALANQYVFAPIVEIEHIEDSRSTNRVRVATFASGMRRVVPVFTSEEFFNDWSDGRYSCFTVAGGDLALTLPKGSWLMLNPGKMHSLELSPDDVITLAGIEDATVELPIEELNAEVYVEKDKKQPEYVLEEDDAEPCIDVTAESVETEHTPKLAKRRIEPVSLKDITDSLCKIVSAFSQVEEAYYEQTDTAQAVLGLMVRGLSAEHRFLLIDQIANFARRTYGTAGAIEVYDDLDLKTSHSWALFSVMAPIYVKEEHAESALVIEKERVAIKPALDAQPKKARKNSLFPRRRKGK